MNRPEEERPEMALIPRDTVTEIVAYRDAAVALYREQELAARLRSGPYARVLCRDFLAMAPEPIYDRVVMNPPFDRGRDIDHVHHAMKFLKPGGILAAIMSASAEFSGTAKAEAFRAEVERYGGRWLDLPEGSFREAGTNVNAVLVTVTRRAT